jgi:hypothetical protein
VGYAKTSTIQLEAAHLAAKRQTTPRQNETLNHKYFRAIKCRAHNDSPSAKTEAIPAISGPSPAGCLDPKKSPPLAEPESPSTPPNPAATGYKSSPHPPRTGSSSASSPSSAKPPDADPDPPEKPPALRPPNSSNAVIVSVPRLAHDCPKVYAYARNHFYAQLDA